MANYSPQMDESNRALSEGRMEAFRQVNESLLRRSDLPVGIRAWALRNVAWAAVEFVDLAPSFGGAPVTIPGWDGCRLGAPGVLVGADGALTIAIPVGGVSHANRPPVPGDHEASAAVGFTPFEAPIACRSAVMVGESNGYGATLSWHELMTPTDGAGHRSSWPVMEGCRLIHVDREPVATLAGLPVAFGSAASVLIANLATGEVLESRDVAALPVGQPWTGWQPFVDAGGKLLHISSWAPTTVIDLPAFPASPPFRALRVANPLVNELRGGSPGVRVDRGWLFLADFEVQLGVEGSRSCHRFVLLDDQFQVSDASLPFRLAPSGRVSTGGLEREGNDLRISWVQGEREAWLGLVDLEQVLSLLQPLEQAETVSQTGIRSARSAIAPALPAGPWNGELQPEWVLPCWTNVGSMFTLARDGSIGVWLREGHGWAEPEFEALRQWIEPGMTVIDVGANIGYFTLELARLVGPGGRVVAIEPEPANFDLLRANCAINDLEWVDFLRAACDREDGIANLHISGDANLGAHRAHGGKGDVTAPKYRLDSILDPTVPIGFIKVDVEGMDHRVIEGALGTMQRWRCGALVEFSPASIRDLGDDPEAVLRWYGQQGFEARLLPFEARILGDTFGADYRELARRDLRIAGLEPEIVGWASALGLVNLILGWPRS